MTLATGKSRANKAEWAALQGDGARYESLGRAVREALGPAVQRSASITELIEHFGGTRAVAKELGVTQRTVERYRQYEQYQARGEKPPASARNFERSGLVEKTRDLLGGKRGKGATAHYEGQAVMSETVWEASHAEDLSASEMDELRDLAESGDLEELGHRFEEIFGDRYVPGMVMATMDDLTFN